MMSPDRAATLRAAAGLSLAAAVSLGLARFAYALLLPPMRADLGWSYFTGGAMNTANAAGYLIGALLVPRWLTRHDARSVLLAGSAATALLLAAHGLVTGDAALLALRLFSGAASAAMFVSGGLLAARLASAPGAAAPGLVLGIFYGGTGAGIVASALVVPAALAQPGVHVWQWAWFALAALALAAMAVIARATHQQVHAAAAPTTGDAVHRFGWQRFAFALGAYGLFGLGYIGYMTFVVTLLREQGLGGATIVAFYVLLGCGVMASPWIWAGLLQRRRDGMALALLNGLLALATMLPVLAQHPAAAFASGALFGGVFLSLVASTTALVRHNLTPAAWPSGIAAFTVVFAAGQIAGPALVGWIADGPGGLERGFVGSAAALALAALLASRQRALG